MRPNCIIRNLLAVAAGRHQLRFVKKVGSFPSDSSLSLSCFLPSRYLDINDDKRSLPFRWLRTVVTSQTASNRQAYTPVMSMPQKAVQSTPFTSWNQPAHTNGIMLYAVKCSFYVVGPFLCRILHKSWSTGVKMGQNEPEHEKRDLTLLCIILCTGQLKWTSAICFTCNCISLNGHISINLSSFLKRFFQLDLYFIPEIKKVEISQSTKKTLGPFSHAPAQIAWCVKTKLVT